MADRDLQKEFDQLKKDLGKLQGDLKDLTEAGSAVAGETVTQARERLEAETQRLIARLQESAGELKGRGQKVIEEVEHQVEEKPMPTLLTTFGVGFLLGWLLSRK